ncbi:MAG: hypothetical protein JSV16_14105 [Candidatus Hydrogenedentota bacterium]|nr:MAG: hypothetical protein JSV16_14105 [Candidatus Hydrogenedentota bacterium]
MNSPEIDELFDKLRKAGHGSVITFDAADSGEPVEGIIFDPGPHRRAGFESGVFVAIPSDANHIYYLDPDASKQEGRLIIQVIPTDAEMQAPESLLEDLMREFEHIRHAPDVKRGGGTTGEDCSKHKGIVELE